MNGPSSEYYYYYLNGRTCIVGSEGKVEVIIIVKQV